MQKLIDRALNSLEQPLAMRIFCLVSFLESALLPIPVETLSLPLFTARKNPWPVALWGTLSSVIGGIVGYLLGYTLLETVGQWLMGLYGSLDQLQLLQSQVAENLPKGAWIIFLGAVSPLPFKLVSIAAGAIGFPFWLYLLIALIGRSLRFTAFALAFAWFGAPIRRFMQQHPKLITIMVVLMMILGFGAILL